MGSGTRNFIGIFRTTLHVFLLAPVLPRVEAKMLAGKLKEKSVTL